MNADIKNIFIEALAGTKNDEIDKVDIIRLAEECGIEISARTSKIRVINKIVEEGYYDRLYEAFSEFIYIPIWIVADFFKVNSDDILQLEKLGVITEIPATKEFYNRRSKEYYTANTYNIKILEHYKKDELQEILKSANSGNGYKLRIETDTEKEVKLLINELGKIFKLSEYKTYERRNMGFNTYLNIKILNNSELEKNTLLEDIQNLKMKIENEKNKYKKNMELMRTLIDERNKKIMKLESELNQYKESVSNPFNAGRKERFTDQEKLEILQLRNNKKTIKQLADMFNCSVGTIHKIIKEKNKD